MRISENGIAMIKRFEGFAAHVYNDVGHQAVGYGHDLQPGEEYPNGISQDEADLLLRKDLASRYEPTVSACVPPECTQNQYDSLCSFAYNLGTGALKTMLAHGWEFVPEQILRWNHVGGVENAALSARRQQEAALFKS